MRFKEQNTLKLSTIVVLSLLFVGVIPLIALSTLSTLMTKDALQQSAYNQLNATRSIKAKKVGVYLSDRQSDINVLASTTQSFYNQSQEKIEELTQTRSQAITQLITKINQELMLFSQSYDTSQALKAFHSTWVRDTAPQDNARWRINEDIYGPHVEAFKNAFNWHDALLISPDGDVLFTVTKGSDLGANLGDERLKDSSLNRAYQKAKTNEIQNVFSDFLFYEPSQGFASFVIRRVEDSKKNTLGYVALQLPLKRINALMASASKGSSAPYSYLVGSDNKLRSDMPFLSMLESQTKGVTLGLPDEKASSGRGVFRNIEGTPSLTQWNTIRVSNDVSWRILTEVPVNKALVPSVNGEKEYYQHYIDEYGYYDLFLIHPDGDIFYTVMKEADYNTNILNGLYSNSNLGRLVQEVSAGKRFGIVDFEPYSPSQNEPAAFIASPILDQDGELIFVVALQLSLDSINAMMQLREGMGETGETYLVGSDFKMRSDSYLDPDSHSVSASFRGSVSENGVDTNASRAALSGKTGTQMMLDYNQREVLSSYSPIQVGGTTWAIISEIDADEAFRSIDEIVLWVSVGVVVAGVLTTLLSFLIARIVIRPLGGEPQEMKALAEQIAGGDLTHTFDNKSAEGSVYHSLNMMSANLKGLVSRISLSSEHLASTATQTSAATEQTRVTITNLRADTEVIANAVAEMASTSAEVASNTETVASLTKTAHQRSVDGIAMLSESDTANQQLMEDIANSAEGIKQLLASTEKVDDVLSTIQNLAEQTNLLALNAAIEAARAGESGRGFAVVADEVRELASRTQAATASIQDIIASVKQETQTTTENMAKSTSQAQEANRLSGETSQVFHAITESIEQIDDMMTQIATASEEQTLVSEDISQRIAHISDTSTQTASSANELASSSQEVASLAEGLTEQTNKFKIS